MDARILHHLLEQLASLIRLRLQTHFTTPGTPVAFSFQINAAPHPFTDFIREHELGAEEITTLLLALAPHVSPNFFQPLIQEFLPQGGEFAEFGGMRTGNHRGLIPTGETALFVLAGNEVAARLTMQRLFSDRHVFHRLSVLQLEAVKDGEPYYSGRLIIGSEWLEKFLGGEMSRPRFSFDFPARLLNTQMTWDDLILHPQTRSQIEMIQIWLEHNAELMKDERLSKKIKPGYRVLFYGPPGTGKTLTATLLGNQFGKEVYRIDLSQVVSKYIGETEKNLEKVFSKAENKDWILFFDEADALFGKRTSVQSSHDRYANQEIAYLLQRLEEFNGLLILASNFKANIDTAFMRRFHQMIYFPMPSAEERQQLWEKVIPQNMKLTPEVDLRQLSQKYELAGAGIVNVMQQAALKAIDRQDYLIRLSDLQDAVKREFQKEEKTA
jgi:AAA+ superfamily predicted ATPase